MIPTGFLFSIAGLGVTLAGFSGLVGAFRRGSALKAMDSDSTVVAIASPVLKQRLGCA